MFGDEEDNHEMFDKGPELREKGPVSATGRQGAGLVYLPPPAAAGRHYTKAPLLAPRMAAHVDGERKA